MASVAFSKLRSLIYATWSALDCYFALKQNFKIRLWHDLRSSDHLTKFLKLISYFLFQTAIVCAVVILFLEIYGFKRELWLSNVGYCKNGDERWYIVEVQLHYTMIFQSVQGHWIYRTPENRQLIGDTYFWVFERLLLLVAWYTQKCNQSVWSFWRDHTTVKG